MPESEAPQSVACPDCTMNGSESELAHDTTCPVALAYDAQQAADREWFENHPFADYYVRPISLAEVIEARAVMGISYPLTTRVKVNKVTDYLRTKEVIV